jgi:hypothetical protein
VRTSGPLAAALIALCGPALAGDGSYSDNPDLKLSGAMPDDVSPFAPREVTDPPFDLEWSVGLRGAYAVDSGGSSLAAILTPEFTLTHDGLNTSLVAGGSGDLEIDSTGAARIAALRLGVEHAIRLDDMTSTAFTGDLAVTQADPDDPSLPANTATAPLVVSGDATASFTREFGPFETILRGSLGRSWHGDTVLEDTSHVDNTADNDWRVGAGGRLGFKLTPLLTPFIDGGVEWQRFDAPSPTLLVYLDALTYSAKAGLAYTLNDLYSAEGAVGASWRDYTDPTLTDAASLTAEASATYKPDETVDLVAGLTTTLAPSTSVPGDTVASYAFSGTASRVLNPWIVLRGSAGYAYDLIIGTGDVTQTTTLGVGLDYKVAEHWAVTSDAGFTRKDAPPAPLADSYQLALGVKLMR